LPHYDTLSSSTLREYEQENFYGISVKIRCWTNVTLNDCLKSPRVTGGR